MKAKPKIKLRCPCCRSEITVAGAKRTIGRTIRIWDSIVEIEALHLKPGSYQWACDDCLDAKRAIQANPGRQKYLDHLPFLAYFNQERSCQTCGKKFLFSAKEQQFWYEKLQFWVQSKPNDCVDCRKRKR